MINIRQIYYLLLYIVRYPQFLIRGNKVPISNKIAKNVFISASKLGKYNYIGNSTSLRLTEIGNYCSIASCVQIGGMEHPYWVGSTSPLLFSNKEISHKLTVIGDDVWIGANVVIRRGVNIGRGAVIGSSSVVLNDVPAYSIVVGIPAKVIKFRFEKKIINKIQETEYWLLKPKQARQVLEDIDYKQ